MAAAAAAAGCVTAEQSREAAEAALLTGAKAGPTAPSAVEPAVSDSDPQAQAEAKSKEEAELDALFPDQKPTSWVRVSLSLSLSAASILKAFIPSG